METGLLIQFTQNKQLVILNQIGDKIELGI